MSVPQYLPTSPPPPPASKIPTWLMVVLAVFGGMFFLCCGGPCVLSLFVRQPSAGVDKKSNVVQNDIERATQAAAKKAKEEQRKAEAAAEEKERKQLEAWAISQDFVRDMVKSPSTASFGSILDGTSQDHRTNVISLGDNEFVVTGWVDSQNAFGATVRAKFVLKIKDEGNLKWSLLEQKLIER